MAPIEFPHPVRYTQLSLAAAHVSLAVCLTYTVGASIYKSYNSLGPSQRTRSRLAQRTKLAPAFAAFALVALSFAVFCSFKVASLSYRTWAHERGVSLPTRLIGEDGVFPNAEHSSQLYIGHWLADTPIYFDTLEIVAERARRFWWGQQIDLATVSWSMLLATEGRRRKIPMLAAFMGLAHLVSLSFAQNLFYLALLYTPSPLESAEGEFQLPPIPGSQTTWIRIRDRLFPRKPKNWSPFPWVFYPSLAVSFGATFMLPYAAGTKSFWPYALALRISTMLHLILPDVVPISWGTVTKQPNEPTDSVSKLFVVVSASSFILHLEATLVGLVQNVPNSQYHRHSAIMPWDIEERSRWDRSTTAIGKVLGSITDHPAVLAMGWDVLICTLSLGLWAATRAADTQDIFGSAIPFYSTGSKSDMSSRAPESTPQVESGLGEDIEPESDRSMTLRSRGRRSHKRVASVASVASSSAASEDVNNTVPVPRKRGRPRKAQPVEEKTYEPTPSEARDAVEGDILPPADLDWETACLSWGMTVVMGLGSACAGVFGAEGPSRRG